jgi:hypothetical protein
MLPVLARAGLLVLRPDVLLSGTRVSGSFKCGRQALLEERFGGTSGRKAMEGTLLHALFEARYLITTSSLAHAGIYNACPAVKGLI